MTALDREAALRLLELGELTVQGRIVAASNATFLGTVRDGESTATCVYKPVRGERPLEDFPDGTLWKRERAAYLVSEASGWNIVPPTVMRDDGPFGEGMAQLWIDMDENADVWRLVNEPDDRLRRIALFDAAVNNADRKGGHLVPAPGGHVYGVDHGISFAAEPKLRTILWDWRGEAIAPDELDVLRALRVRLDGPLCQALQGLLAPAELRALNARVDRLIRTKIFPQPDPYRMAVPWPPF
ncbi:MAG TPA: SCO1664 family protein [Candidatus Limnocylindria bacterium]|nr:SCO1664 family protein [Candidatus Limnocylindria bacterium]